jgi:NAD-dependent dihydropyrimidine dehydrogenase PreA subunit
MVESVQYQNIIYVDQLGSWFIRNESDALELAAQEDIFWLNQYRFGLRQIFLSETIRGTATVEVLLEKITILNELFAYHQLPLLKLKWLTFQEIESIYQQAVQESVHASRRNFFKAIFQQPFQTKTEQDELIQQLTHLPHAVQFDLNRCTACADCIKICPPHALTLDRREEGAFYALNPFLCDGCGLCESVCPVDAIHLQKYVPQLKVELEVRVKSCLHCQHEFHQRIDQVPEELYCVICREVKHLKGDLRIVES